MQQIQSDSRERDWLHPVLREVEGLSLVISYRRADGSVIQRRTVHSVRFHQTSKGERIMKAATVKNGPRHTYILTNILEMEVAL